MPLPYGRLFHSRPALTNCKSCGTQHWELPQDAHKTQTYNICWRNTHISHTRAPTAPRLTVQTENTISITSLTESYNISQRRNTKNTISLTMAATQQTFPHTPHCHYNIIYIKTNMCQIYTSIVSRHLAIRGNNKILHTPPPHISLSEEILPCLTRRTLA